MRDDFVTLALTGGGEVLTLADEQASFIHLPGSTGLGAVETTTRFRSGATPGGVHMGSRLEPRAVLLKVGVLGADRRDLESLWSALLAVCRSDDFALRATYPDGSVWSLPVVYESGLEGDCSADAMRQAEGGWFATADIALTAPDPFWSLVSADTFSVDVDDSRPAFLKPLRALRRSRSRAIADTSITNRGSVESPVSWRFTGPADAGTSVSIGGRGFTISQALGESDVVSVTPRWGRAPLVQLNGATNYGVLEAAPRFPALSPGENAVTLSMPGAVAGTWQVSDMVEVTNWQTNPALRNDAAGLVQDGTFTWSAGQLAFSSATEATVAVYSEYTSWAEQWVSTRWEASGDGVHALVEFWSGDVLTESHYTDTSSDGWLSFGGMAIPDGTTKIRVGVGWHGLAGALRRQALTFTQTSYGWFDGESGDAYAWQGAADASPSDKRVLLKVGGSKVEASWHQRKEVVF